MRELFGVFFFFFHFLFGGRVISVSATKSPAVHPVNLLGDLFFFYSLTIMKQTKTYTVTATIAHKKLN